MTERVFELPNSGPAVVGLDLPIGSVTAQVSASTTVVRVWLRTEDESGPAADAVRAARSRQDGQTLAVEVPDLPANVVTQGVRGGRVMQNATVIGGNVTGMVIVNGRVITNDAFTTTVSPIEARVLLPAGSSLAVVSQSADMSVSGPLERAEFRSVSGDCRLDAVRELTASTTSGDIVAGPVLGSMTARSISGDIVADAYGGHHADLTTTSGDVDVFASGTSTGRLRANTVSGDIRINGGRHLDLSTRSVSGTVRTR